MTKAPPKKPLGRPVTDGKGNRIWEWRPDEKIDTAVVKAMGEGLSIEWPNDTPQTCDPYDRSSNNSSGERENKRRTLDDMRRLSDKIKRSKQWTRDNKDE